MACQKNYVSFYFLVLKNLKNIDAHNDNVEIF